jgi:nucleotide-binding universal stress UspA family protein
VGYATVVVGTDGSATAEQAVRAAAALAAGNAADLVVVAAFGGTVAAGGAPVDEEAAGEVARRGEAVAREAGAARVAVRAVPGEPADVLVATASDVGADLIVVGSRGMTRPSRSTLGAVANTVSHHAGCDVLVFSTEV